ncbi:MAG: TIGR03084 family metal-binding protein [Actinomycetia bacterium]|nr:TIGR03084 family metal-binding protein [Actinomycetes bacterium]
MIDIVTDLQAEQQALDTVIGAIDPSAWRLPTPAPAWDVGDQIGHLTFFDERAAMAIRDEEAFSAELDRASADMGAYMASHLATARSSSPREQLNQWRSARVQVLKALASLEPSTRVPWYGPGMSARSFATARIMETWAHGQDIIDAIGVHRTPTNRLRHIAFLGVRTMAWSFTINGIDVPDQPVHVDLSGPDGDRWVWNEGCEENNVRGTAEDFCLVTTQRRHVSDTDLVVEGTIADRWMNIAQAFAGPPGAGRVSGQFR